MFRLLGVMVFAQRGQRWLLAMRYVASLALACFGASAAFAQAGFAPGCGPFFGGAPNIAVFTNGNQIATNFPIPGVGLGFGLASQPAGCAGYSYRLAPASGPLPAGVTFAGSGTPGSPTVRFSGTPASPLSTSTVTIEVSADSVNWATGARITLDTVSCLSWKGGNNRRYAATYSPSAINVDRGIIPRPVAGVPYDHTLTMLPNAYPAAAYCANPIWSFQYDGENTAGSGGLTASSVAGSTLAVRISGTPTVSGDAALICDEGDSGANATLRSSEGATFPTSLDFCFGGDSGPAPVLALVGSPPSGRVNSPYTFTFTTNPVSAASFTLLSGALPPGVGLSSGGTLSGTPTSPGTFNFTVQANGGAAGVASGTYGITIQSDTPQSSATNIPTLSEWALIALAVLAAAFAMRRLNRKQ
jgi:hypothetical protein